MKRPMEIEPPDESLEEIRARLPHETIVMEVTERDENGQPLRARVLVHSTDEAEAFTRARQLGKRGLSFFHALPPEEAAQIAFL